jgi:hypothetical protein
VRRGTSIHKASLRGFVAILNSRKLRELDNAICYALGLTRAAAGPIARRFPDTGASGKMFVTFAVAPAGGPLLLFVPLIEERARSGDELPA